MYFALRVLLQLLGVRESDMLGVEGFQFICLWRLI
jgi:hypothetical protein